MCSLLKQQPWDFFEKDEVRHVVGSPSTETDADGTEKHAGRIQKQAFSNHDADKKERVERRGVDENTKSKRSRVIEGLKDRQM